MKGKEKWVLWGLMGLFVFNGLVFLVWMPDESFVPLRTGDFLVDGKSRDDVKVAVKWDRFAPINLNNVALANMIWVVSLGVILTWEKRGDTG